MVRVKQTTTKSTSGGGKKPASPPAAGKRKYRHKPGVVATREIIRLQKSTKPILPRLPYERVVREIAQELLPDGLRFGHSAISALQEAGEQYMVELFGDAKTQAGYAQRKTVTGDDMKMVLHLQRRTLPCNWSGEPAAPPLKAAAEPVKRRRARKGVPKKRNVYLQSLPEEPAVTAQPMDEEDDVE